MATLPKITPLGWLAIAAGAVAAWKVLKGSGVRQESPTAVGPYAVIGDSLAVGLSAPLKVELGDVTGWGVGGSIAALWTMQIEAVMVTKPKTVIVSLGTNDVLSPDARSKFAARIQTIVDKIKAGGALPVLLQSPASLPNMLVINDALFATGALVVGTPAGIEMAPDKVHPTGKGYKQWAQKIREDIT